MKFVALISGGKDSIYSIYKCLQHGHELVCLANLYPEGGEDEIDSWTFQTVAHSAVEAIAAAMKVPLIRHPIKKGTSLVTSLTYPSEPSMGDEVEELAVLLEKVKSAFPDVGAVCTGAILSNYQRLRVETVCFRLGLVSLGYLWQRDQDEYVAELCDSGFDVILVKVAAMGLLPRKHLGRHLGDMRDYLASMDHCHSAGEGGEYESYVIDCPLFHSRIEVVDSEVVLLDDNPVCPSGLLRFSTALVPKEKPLPTVPRIAHPHPVPKHSGPAADQYRYDDVVEKLPTVWTSPDGKWAVISRLSASTFQELAGEKPQKQASELLTRAKGILQAKGLRMEDVAYVHVIGRDISHFAEVNAGYVPHFGCNPPSRAFVELSTLPHDIEIEILAYSGERSTLHVQSISEWAPACIGPYAQATTLGNAVLHAGMLGLDPPSMLPVGSSEDCTAAAIAQFKQAVVNYKAVMPAVASKVHAVTHGVVYTVDAEKSAEGLEREWEASFPSSPMVLVGVTHLPKYTASEVQLMSATALDSVSSSWTEEGVFTVAYSHVFVVLAPLSASDPEASLKGALQQGSNHGEVGHVRLLVTPQSHVPYQAIPSGKAVSVIPCIRAQLCHENVPKGDHAGVIQLLGTL
eukprot:Sspe_Gene.10274::Locus_3432_Transcript_1_1_Confidence_1.000_Length_2418::g.10274::m.10274/K06927/DPH6; diphthine-ammonia ligase